jgi:hypothetical protein
MKNSSRSDDYNTNEQLIEERMAGLMYKKVTHYLGT